MLRWEYTIIRQDTLEGFQWHLESLGNEGWEAVSANYVLHAEEDLESGKVPPRPVWIALLKRTIE
jgi:hypothetical protein